MNDAINSTRPIRRLATFFAGSAGGLVVDLGGFTLLTVLGLIPATANALSSICSISVVYLLVSRWTFGASTRATTYLAFFGWYAMNILVTSATIQFATVHLVAIPVLWKLASIPVSFTANYAFSTLLFERLTRREALPQKSGDSSNALLVTVSAERAVSGGGTVSRRGRRRFIQ